MTGTVAPHRGHEVRMVLAGHKPLATIEHDKDPDQYVLAVCLMGAGMLVGKVEPTDDCPLGEITFTSPAQRAALDKYEVLKEIGPVRMGPTFYHREMGRLFGYSEEDIDAFIAAEVQCTCSKCTGGSNED